MNSNLNICTSIWIQVKYVAQWKCVNYKCLVIYIYIYIKVLMLFWNVKFYYFTSSDKCLSSFNLDFNLFSFISFLIAKYGPTSFIIVTIQNMTDCTCANITWGKIPGLLWTSSKITIHSEWDTFKEYKENVCI